MPLFDRGHTYSDGEPATEDIFNDPWDALEQFLNVTKLDDDNIQPGSLTVASLDPSIGNALPGATVSSLPGSPADGQIVYYANAAMTILGIAWQLRYNAALSGSKWQFIGGGAYTATGGFTTTGSGSYGFASGGPAITVPLTGEYTVRLSGSIIGGAMSIAKNGTSSDARAAFQNNDSTGSTVIECDMSLTAADSLAATIKKTSGGGGNADTDRRYMTLIPKRVS